MKNRKLAKLSKKNNYLYLIFGILFLAYGSFRTLQKTRIGEENSWGMAVVLGLAAVGVYFIYKFFKNLKTLSHPKKER